MKRNKIILLILVITAVCALVLSSFLFGSTEETDSSKENSEPIVEELNISSELVSLDEHNGLLKIDLISPGLDTYGLDVVIYNTESKKLISKTNIGEGSWISGLIDDGFYVIEQTSKTLRLFDTDGKEILSKTFVSDDIWSSACGLSRDGKQLVYTTLQQGNVCMASVESGETKLIETGVFCTEFVGVKEGKFYLRSVDGELMLLTESECRSLVSDKRMSEFSTELCAGNAEYGIALTFTDNVLIKYLQIKTVDETIIGIGRGHIATCVSSDNTDQIKNYDLINGTYTTAEIEECVKGLVFVQDGGFIAVAGDNNKLYFFGGNSGTEKKFSLNSIDKPIQSSERFDPPKTNTANSDKLIQNVPLIHQFPEFPTGCESVSAVMALKYLGEDITVTEFVDDYLAKSSNFHYLGGKKYGPNPYEVFIGNPKTASSFGCMAPVITTALQNYFEDEKRVVNTTETSLYELCAEYIDNDIPVLVWATIGMLETVPNNSWYLENDQRFTWPGNEHCLLLVGYDESNYYFNDPYSGKCVSYVKELCEDRYAELGHQSVVILP